MARLTLTQYLQERFVQQQMKECNRLICTSFDSLEAAFEYGENNELHIEICSEQKHDQRKNG